MKKQEREREREGEKERERETEAWKMWGAEGRGAKKKPGYRIPCSVSVCLHEPQSVNGPHQHAH